MSSPSSRYAIGLASSADADALVRLYESDDFTGDISVLYTRRPDPWASLLAEGDRVVVPTVTDTVDGVLLGMGACVVRDAWVNGEPRRVGYLTGLKGLPEYRGKVPVIPRVYAYLREHTADDVELYYTTILADNEPVRRMLERRRRNMPEYRLVGGYTASCFRWRAPRTRSYRLARGTVAELSALQPAGPDAPNLAPCGPLPGLTDADVWLLRDRAGEVVAGCGVLDQRAHKQYIVTRYGGRYRWLRHLPTALAGYPRLPRENAVADHASVTNLVVRGDDPELARLFLGFVGGAHRGRDFLMWGHADSDPLGPALSRGRSVAYRSLLYTVHFTDDSLALDGRPVRLEVALL